MIVLFYIMGCTVALGVAASCVMVTYSHQIRNATKKRHIEPKVNFPEDGVCQCGDAFCYHAGSMGCQIPNCPCQMFVSSTIKSEFIDQMTAVAVAARTAELEEKVAEHKVQTAHKQRQLERGYS